jgi:hypothetical protein
MTSSWLYGSFPIRGERAYIVASETYGRMIEGALVVERALIAIAVASEGSAAWKVPVDNTEKREHKEHGVCS